MTLNQPPSANGGGRSQRKQRSGALSAREREVLGLLARGMSGSEIAESLVLSPETVRTHIRNAMAKLDASTRSQAVAIALSRSEIGEGGNGGAATAPPAPGRVAPRPGAQANGKTTTTTMPRATSESLRQVLDGLVALWDVDGGWIFLADEDGMALELVAGRSGGNGVAEPAERLVLGEGQLGRVALERRPQVIGSPLGSGPAVIAAPMVTGGRLVGLMGLATRPSRPIGRQELLLLQAFAGRIADVVHAGGERAPARLRQAMDRFRASWASTTRVI